MKGKVIILGGVVSFLVANLFAGTAHAVPVFARKYQTSCQTCHSMFPKLTPFGEAFRINGYQVPEKEETYVKEEPVLLGAEGYKKTFPNSVWPSAMDHLPPIGFQAHLRVDAQEGNGTSPKGNFEFPHEFEYFVAGALSEDITFFGEGVFFDEGNEIGLERLFVQFSDPFDRWLPKNSLNIKVGLYDLPLQLGYPESTKITMDRKLASNNRFGETDSGLRFRDAVAGIEFNGLPASRLFYAVGVTNGTGMAGPTFDENWKKDLYASLRYKFGGIALDNTGEKEEGTILDNSFTVGLGAYLGWDVPNDDESVGRGDINGDGDVTDTDVQVAGQQNTFYRLGGDLRFTHNKLELVGGGLYAKDMDIDGLGTDATNYAFFGEGNYFFFPWMLGTVRYDQTIAKGAGTNIGKIVPAINFLVRANVKIGIEGAIFPQDGDGADRIRAGLAVAF